MAYANATHMTSFPIYLDLCGGVNQERCSETSKNVNAIKSAEVPRHRKSSCEDVLDFFGNRFFRRLFGDRQLLNQ